MPMVKIWDLPTRIFHWTLALLILYQLSTSLLGEGPSETHLYVGYVITTLVLFRISWGFYGGTTSKFINFLYAPSTVLNYLFKKNSQNRQFFGHNPAGGYSVIFILASVAIQTITGMFCDDDIMLAGPLRSLVADDTTSIINQIHSINAWFLLGLITLHLVAITWHYFFKKDNIISPMVTGKKNAPATLDQNINVQENLRRAALLLMLASLIVLSIMSQG